MSELTDYLQIRYPPNKLSIVVFINGVDLIFSVYPILYTNMMTFRFMFFEIHLQKMFPIVYNCTIDSYTISAIIIIVISQTETYRMASALHEHSFPCSMFVRMGRKKSQHITLQSHPVCRKWRSCHKIV